MVLKVDEGYDIVNVDNGKLEKLRNGSSDVDKGAKQVLEALDLFCEDLIATFEDSSSMPYEKMFQALQVVIGSSLQKKDVRDAIMTGIIRFPIKKGVAVNHKNESKKQIKKEDEKVELDLEEVRKFAKTHTKYEVAQNFGISVERAKNYMSYHHIEYVFCNVGRKPTVDKDKVAAVAKGLTRGELAKMFGMTPRAMGKFLCTNKIEYKKKRN